MKAVDKPVIRIVAGVPEGEAAPAKYSHVAGLVGRFNVVNIKLDKCGGLTEGLAIARTAREQGLDTMVGNMLSTSLSMAPAFLTLWG